MLASHSDRPVVRAHCTWSMVHAWNGASAALWAISRRSSTRGQVTPTAATRATTTTASASRSHAGTGAGGYRPSCATARVVLRDDPAELFQGGGPLRHLAQPVLP